MSTVHETEMTGAEKFALALKSHSKKFIAAAVAVVVILAAVGVNEYFGNQKNEQSVVAAEDVEEALVSYLTAAEDEKEAARETLSGLIDSAKKDYSGLYAEMKALSAEARMLADEEKWNDAAAAYTALADGFSDSFAAPVALLNAAAMKEEAGEADAAMALYSRVVDEFAEVSPDVPEALFNLGRLSEATGDSDKAREYYESIGSDYSSSSWTNLAKSRIIAIKAGS